MRSKTAAARFSEEKAGAFIAGPRALAGCGPLTLIERAAEPRPKLKPGLY
jgi:hypothetical protein